MNTQNQLDVSFDSLSSGAYCFYGPTVNTITEPNCEGVVIAITNETFVTTMNCRGGVVQVSNEASETEDNSTADGSTNYTASENALNIFSRNGNIWVQVLDANENYYEENNLVRGAEQMKVDIATKLSEIQDINDEINNLDITIDQFALMNSPGIFEDEGF